ncbi:MAG: Hsp20/alpha crystallin family protein [Bacillota bacterium]|nr:MAG: Hsp20/alpha crystallin family protein [Bacillota bacterium]
MSMERWRPGGGLRGRPGHWLDRFFDFDWVVGRPFWPASTEEGRRWGLVEPAVDVFETDQHMVVKAELPGLEPRDLKVTVTEDSVALRGETGQEREETQEGYHWRERRHGLVQRLIPLARHIDPGSARASYRNGVLTIRVLKRGDDRGRTVNVEVESEPEGFGDRTEH